MTQQQTGIVDWAVGFLYEYGWLLIALLVCPYAAFRITQFMKNYWRDIHARHLHALQLRAIGFAICWLLALYCLTQQFQFGDQVVFGAFLIGVLHAGIVEALFRHAKAKSPALYAALRGELYADDPTFAQAMVGAAVGAKPKHDKRKAQQPYEGEDRRQR